MHLIKLMEVKRKLNAEVVLLIQRVENPRKYGVVGVEEIKDNI